MCPRIYSAMEAENERSPNTADLWSQKRHMVTLPGNPILQPLREVSKPGYYNANFFGNSDETGIEFFQGQDENFEEEGFSPMLLDLQRDENKLVRFEKLIKMLNSWSTTESRIAGSPEFISWPKLNGDDYVVDWRLIEVDPSRATNFRKM